MPFSMACWVEGTREPQPNVRRLPRRDCPRLRAPERQSGRGPSFIELLPLLAGRPGLRRVQRLVLVLGWQPQPAPPVLGTRTARPHGTRPTRVLVEFYDDGPTALATPMLPPRHRQVALGAAHLLLVPVHRKLLEGVRALNLCLPPLAGAYGPPQDNALFVTA